MKPSQVLHAALAASLALSCRAGTQVKKSAAHQAPGEPEFLATPVDPEPALTPDLVEHGRELFMKNCVACHGKLGNGKGYGAPFLVPPPRDFTAGVFRLRTTPTGSLPTDADLYRTISRGVGGTAMPAWKWFLPDPKDRWALVAYIKTLSERWKTDKPEPPIELSQPPATTPESLAKGKELYGKMGCFNCHGEQGLGDGPASMTLKDDAGLAITARDFSNPAKFKGGWSEREIARTFLTGLDGTPMPSYRGAVPDADIWALAGYVKSLGHPSQINDALSHGSGDFEKTGSANKSHDLGKPDIKIALLERGWHYEPNEIHIKKGQVVELTMTATDNGLGAGHGFSVDGFDQNTFLNGVMVGAPKTVKFRIDQAGTYKFHCVTQCSTGYLHPGMSGTLIVEE